VGGRVGGRRRRREAGAQVGELGHQPTSYGNPIQITQPRGGAGALLILRPRVPRRGGPRGSASTPPGGGLRVGPLLTETLGGGGRGGGGDTPSTGGVRGGRTQQSTQTHKKKKHRPPPRGTHPTPPHQKPKGMGGELGTNFQPELWGHQTRWGPPRGGGRGVYLNLRVGGTHLSHPRGGSGGAGQTPPVCLFFFPRRLWEKGAEGGPPPPTRGRGRGVEGTEGGGGVCFYDFTGGGGTQGEEAGPGGHTSPRGGGGGGEAGRGKEGFEEGGGGPRAGERQGGHPPTGPRGNYSRS